MLELKRNLVEYFRDKKTIVIFSIVLFALLISVGIPTLARYRKRTSMIDSVVWDGSIATSYRSGTGTSNDPYVISNGSEFAYFAENLKTETYDNTYFVLKNDIVLNDGIFGYDETNGLTYYINDTTYYLNEYANLYYDNISKEGDSVGSVNLFNSIKNFNGYLNGDAHTIYGLYITSNTEEELALFNNLTGIIHDLYVDNSLIYGGSITSGLVVNAKNSEIKNVLFDGFVVGKNEILSANKEINLDVIELNVSENILETIDIALPFINGNINEIKLTGKVDADESLLTNNNIKINGEFITENEFLLDLGKTLNSEINLEVQFDDLIEDEIAINFTDLKYSISYSYSNVSGIVSNSIDTVIENCINKADIYGNLYSAGITNVLSNSEIKNAYNTGKIKSNKIAAGLINNIINTTDEISIENVYNSGVLEGEETTGLFTNILNSNAFIKNSFNTGEATYNILSVENSDVVIDNSYSISSFTVKNGIVTGGFDEILLEELYTKQTMLDILLYNEFVDLATLNSDSTAVWVYEDGKLPILYIDDASQPIANIHLSKYVWNNLGYDLNNIIFSSNIIFSIEAADELNPLKSIEYYLHRASNALNKEELENIESWKSYDSLVTINEEGFYVIYAKVTDFDDNVSYLNTDLLVLDLSGSLIRINVNDRKWESSKNSLDQYYVNSSTNVVISASDMLSGVASIKYYLSSTPLMVEDLSNLEDSKWIYYDKPLNINKNDKVIVYVKATDNAEFVTYANTDYIIYNGYDISNMILGRNTDNTLNDIYITDKSAISLEFNYSDEFGYQTGYTHNLISNILLPINTELTLLDKVNNVFYKYKIDTVEDLYGYDINGYATYPLALFKNTKVSIDEYFNEADYYNLNAVNESFKLTLDFSDTELTEDYTNINLYMTINDSNGNVVRNTLNDSLKTFNISAESNASTYLNLEYTDSPIVYNVESTTDVLVTTGLTYNYIDKNKIYDTTYEDMNMGLIIKLVNDQGNLIGKKHLKNLLIKIDDIEYAADNDGVYHINLNSGVDNISKTLKFVTFEDNLKLPLGEYNFIISNYIAYDGQYTTITSDNEVKIPVLVTNSNINIKHSFDVLMDDASKVITKTELNKKLSFSIIQNGALKNPNIRVSLYKKNELTAYNQDYSLIDISKYVSNNLVLAENEKYYLSTNPISYNGQPSSYNNFELDLICRNFENTGYKLVFDLYDGYIKVDTIEKKIIFK